MAIGTRLAVGMTIVLSLTVYLVFLGSTSSWQYYLTVDECLAEGSELLHSPVRVSGDVVAESLRSTPDGVGAVFLLAGSRGTLTVNCTGPLPDQFIAGRPVVVEGQLQSGGVLVSDKVLTRCASKYSSAPPARCPDSRRAEVE
jgi:cytochrome c-type biogenesis protein CcmE